MAHNNINTNINTRISKDSTYSDRHGNMADGNVRVEQIAPALCSKVVVKDNICECCNKIKLELDDLKSELKSCKEIIRILHENVQIDKSTLCATEVVANKDRMEEIQTNLCAQNEGWQNVVNRKKKPHNAVRQLRQLPLCTSNQFAQLLNLNDDVVGLRHPKNDSYFKVLSDITVKNDKRKIVIIRDSHARNCAAGLQRQLGRKCSVIGHIKLGAGMKQIVQTGRDEIEKLNGDDVLVVWGGSNDISKQNSQEALRQLSNFVKKCQDVNVIVMSAPQRYDLMPSLVLTLK